MEVCGSLGAVDCEDILSACPGLCTLVCHRMSEGAIKVLTTGPGTGRGLSVHVLVDRSPGRLDVALREAGHRNGSWRGRLGWTQAGGLDA